PATAISITGRTSGPPRRSVLRAADHELPDALSDLVTEALAAHDGRAAAKYEHVVAASRATHLLDMVDVDEAGAVDLQHRLRAQRLLGVEERAARVEGVLADRQLHVVAVGGHELDLGDIDHVHRTADLGEQAGPRLEARLRQALQLRECRGGDLVIRRVARRIALAHAAQ